MEIDHQYIRQRMWLYFREATRCQMDDVLNHIRYLIGNDKWTEKIAFIVHEEVFALSISGLIMFAQPVMHAAGSHSGYPWITVTQRGKACFEGDALTPYDPDGYIQKIKDMIPEIDDITMKYLSESINAYNRHAPISATIALGIASEQMILLLIEAYIAALKNEKERDFLSKKIQGRFIETQYVNFKNSFNSHSKAIPQQIVRDIDTAIDMPFRFIKMLRNEQGHPTDIAADRDTVYADLQHFPHYARRMCELIKWLRANKL